MSSNRGRLLDEQRGRVVAPQAEDPQLAARHQYRSHEHPSCDRLPAIEAKQVLRVLRGVFRRAAVVGCGLPMSSVWRRRMILPDTLMSWLAMTTT